MDIGLKRLILLAAGSYAALVGAALAASPPVGKRLTAWLFKDKVSRPWALMPLGMGLALMWASEAGRFPQLIRLLGLLSFLKSCYLLVAPRPSALRILRWWQGLPSVQYRIWGAVSLLVGALLLCGCGQIEIRS